MTSAKRRNKEPALSDDAPGEAASDLSVDVAVVGAGPVGLAAAAVLADQGHSVALIDRISIDALLAPGADGRTTAIAAVGKPFFESIGVWAALEERAGTIDDIVIVDQGAGNAALHYGAEEVGGGPMGWIVDNADLRRALAEAVRARSSVTVMDGDSVRDTEVDAGAAELHLSSGKRVSVRLVVAADGRMSRLREGAGIRTVSWPYGQSSLVCTVSHPTPHRNTAFEIFRPDGPLALLPLPGGHASSVVWSQSTAEIDRLSGLDEAAFSAAISGAFGDRLGPLTLEGERWSWPLSLVQAERYIDRRLVLVGDAARAIHPIAGQGFNLGIKDIAALAEVLAEARRLGLDLGSAHTLERYQRWRRFESTLMVAATDGLNRLFATRFAPVRAARGIGLAVLGRLPGLKRTLIRGAMGTLGTLPALLKDG